MDSPIAPRRRSTGGVRSESAGHNSANGGGGGGGGGGGITGHSAQRPERRHLSTFRAITTGPRRVLPPTDALSATAAASAIQWPGHGATMSLRATGRDGMTGMKPPLVPSTSDARAAVVAAPTTATTTTTREPNVTTTTAAMPPCDGRATPAGWVKASASTHSAALPMSPTARVDPFARSGTQGAFVSHCTLHRSRV
jgi:hypothetical protein